MTRCTAPETGRLLHAYELHQLSPEDTELFEEHLLTCNQCFEEVSQFEQVAGMLVSDAEVRDLARTSARADRKQGFLSNLKSIVWPTSVPLALRPAVTYVALALLIYPAYLGLKSESQPTVRSTQTVILSGTRGVTQQSIASTRPMSLVFRVGGTAPGEILVVELTDEAGKTLFLDKSFSGLSPAGLGTIGFDENALASGRYLLTVKDRVDSQLVQYPFQID